MTYNSGSPAMTPEQKLASKRWRRINSWWIFPPVLSLGLLGWLGFLVAAARTRKRIYWVFTGVYAGLLTLFFVLISGDPEGIWSDIALIPYFGVWIAPTIHAAVLNRRYLRELAALGDWYAAPLAAPDAAAYEPEPPILGVSRQDYYAPTGQATRSAPPRPEFTPERADSSYPAPPPPAHAPNPIQDEPVDVNTAGQAALSALPGVGDSLAQRIIAIRDARGGYRDIDDLASAANLQPHELVRIRDKVAFGGPGTGAQQRPNYGGSGRILDI